MRAKNNSDLKKRTLTGWIISVLFMFNIALLALLLLSAFSDRVSPTSIVFFAYLGLAFPFILLINLLFCCWWIITLKWKRLLYCLLTLLICHGSIQTYYPVHSQTKQLPDNCIKVLSYNTMSFQHMYSHAANNPNRIVQYMIESKADIICIQEYAVSTQAQSYLLTEEQLNRALKDYPYKKVNVQVNANHTTIGIAIFSKFPILSARVLDIESTYNGVMEAEIDIHGKRTTLINCHLESNKLSIEERSEYSTFIGELKDRGINLDSKKIDDMYSKMANKLTPAFKLRSAQAELVAKAVENSPNPYILVCGDFNDTPISYARRTVKGDLMDSFVESGFGLGITFNKYRFYFRIDYIMHSNNIKSYNCTVDNKINNSDHYPIWTYLELD